MKGVLLGFAKLAGGAGVTVLIGLLSFVLVYFALEKLLPFSITRELGEKRNPADAVLLLSVMVGLGLILAAKADARPPSP